MTKRWNGEKKREDGRKRKGDGRKKKRESDRKRKEEKRKKRKREENGRDGFVMLMVVFILVDLVNVQTLPREVTG